MYVFSKDVTNWPNPRILLSISLILFTLSFTELNRFHNLPPFSFFFFFFWSILAHKMTGLLQTHASTKQGHGRACSLGHACQNRKRILGSFMYECQRSPGLPGSAGQKAKTIKGLFSIFNVTDRQIFGFCSPRVCEVAHLSWHAMRIPKWYGMPT